MRKSPSVDPKTQHLRFNIAIASRVSICSGGATKHVTPDVRIHGQAWTFHQFDPSNYYNDPLKKSAKHKDWDSTSENQNGSLTIKKLRFHEI